MAVNSVTVIGNVGATPEVRTLPSGQSVANLSLATTERFTDRNGGKNQRTEWHRIVAFGKLADTCAQYLSKGRQVYVEGRLTTREYEAKDGSGKRYRTEVVARQIRFLDRRRCALIPSGSLSRPWFTTTRTPKASARSEMVLRVRLRPPAKSCDTNPLLFPSRLASSAWETPDFSSAVLSISVTSKISSSCLSRRRFSAEELSKRSISVRFSIF